MHPDDGQAVKMPQTDHPDRPATAGQKLVDLLALVACGAVGFVTVGALLTESKPARVIMDTPTDICPSVDDAYLSGSIYGGIERRIEWRGTDMSCEGGLRPDAGGIRLVFAGRTASAGDRLVIVIGIGGTLDQLNATELAANVTLIDESSGRFFSTGGQERCWTAVSDVTGDSAGIYRITGELYCAGSLPSLSDGGSVTLRDFRYSGRLSTDDP